MSSWRSHKLATIGGALLGLMDIAITTVTFVHGDDFKNQFLINVYLYDVSTSMFELWVFGLVRMTVITGGILGFICQANVAVNRFRKSKPVVTILLTLMWVYTLTKLLMYTEAMPDLNRPWFWALFAWTQLAILLMYVTWGAFSNITIDDQETCDASVNTSDEERQPLLGDRQHEEERKTEDKSEEKKLNVSSMKSVWRLLKFSRPDWHIVLTGFIFLCLSSLSEVFLPFYTGAVIDGIAIKKSSKLFVRAIIIMAVLSIGSSFAAGIRGGCFKITIARLHMRVCNSLFSSLMKQEVAFYDQTRTGEITSRLTSDTMTMANALSLNLNIFLRNVIQAVGTSVFMFRLSWQLSMVTVMGMPIIMVVSELYGEYYKNLSKKVQDTLAKANEVAEETCSSMRTVRSFANEKAEAERYASRLMDTYRLKVKEAMAYAGFMWCTDLFGLSLVVATLYYGGHLVIDDRLTGGRLVSFILYQMQLGYCIESISSVYTGVMQAVGASEKVFEFLDRKSLIRNEGKLKPNAFLGAVQFKNVTFSYPSRTDAPVLKNVSFSVKPGEIVALVGPSGGGKSTCVNLLEHFYETSSGQVLLDDIPIEKYDHKFLHTKVALVGQEPVLYARSIRENIAYGTEDASNDTIEKAGRQANAHEFITELKDKYETEAGEKGTQLSGGQKQRVAIARALVRKPSILLLDEATSALDSESEHIVQQAIYNNLHGHTVIIVAHRLSTVEKANRIIIINKGEVVEEGSHRELLQCGGMYAQLVKRQMLGFDVSPEEVAPCTSQSPSNLSTSYGSFKSIDSKTSEPDHEGLLILKTSALSRSPEFGSV